MAELNQNKSMRGFTFNMINIVILNYNGYRDTLSCLYSIVDSQPDSFRIIIVDNNSTDESVEKISLALFGLDNEYMDVNCINGSLPDMVIRKSKYILIKSDINGGYAYGNNLALKYLICGQVDNGEFVLILNNDTVVLKNTLNKLKEVYGSLKKPAILGPTVVDYHAPINCHVETEDLKVNEVQFISGCAMFFSIGIVSEFGFLPEEYFLYYEETDWLRSLNSLGVFIYKTPECFVKHKVASSTGGVLSPLVLYYMTRNRFIYMRKFNYSRFFLLLIYLKCIGKVFYMIKKPRCALSIFRGVIDAFRGVVGKVERY